MDYYSAVEFFNQNIATKLIEAVDSLLPSSEPKELFVNHSWSQLIFRNPSLLSAIKGSQMRVGFYEVQLLEYVQSGNQNCIFLTSSDMKLFRKNLAFINQFLQRKNKKLKLFLIFYPSKNYENKLFLEENASEVFKKEFVKAVDLNFDFFPVEKDFFVNLYENSLNELFAERQFTHLQLAAENLHKLQIIFGKFRETISIGGAESLSIIENLKNLARDNEQDFLLENGFFEGCIVCDRSLDLLTALLVPFSYESLLDEFFGFEFHAIIKPLDKGGSEPEFINEEKDKIFAQYKDFHLVNFMKNVSGMIKELKELKITNQMSIEESKVVAEKVQNKQFIEFHLKFATKIDDFLKEPETLEKVRLQQLFLYESNEQSKILDQIIDMIKVNAQIETVLNLLMIYNLLFRGFSGFYFRLIQRLLVQNYGIEMIKPLCALNISGFMIN